MISDILNFLLWSLMLPVGLFALAGLAILWEAIPSKIAAIRARLYWTRTLRDVMQTDASMLMNCIRLSVAHFKALNELHRKR